MFGMSSFSEFMEEVVLAVVDVRHVVAGVVACRVDVDVWVAVELCNVFLPKHCFLAEIGANSPAGHQRAGAKRCVPGRAPAGHHRFWFLIMLRLPWLLGLEFLVDACVISDFSIP